MSVCKGDELRGEAEGHEHGNNYSICPDTVCMCCQSSYYFDNTTCTYSMNTGFTTANLILSITLLIH